MEYNATIWRQILISLKIKVIPHDPFRDVDIEALFHGPCGETLKRQAYWDGENEYKISFAPTSVGDWTYEVHEPTHAVIGETAGHIHVTPYMGELDIYKHGFLKVESTKHYLMYHDNTPFFWLGDTHWEFAYKEKWDESNHPNMESMFKGMVDKRVEQGYSVYQTNLRSDALMGGEAYYWKTIEYLGQKVRVPNIEFYQKELDRRMLYLADKGLVNALGLAWFMSITDHITEQKELARYIVARYGALPMVWTLAGEVAGYTKGEERNKNIDGWREVAKYIESIDGYHTLQTAHYTNERPFAEDYQTEEWFDFTLNQAGHGDYLITANDYKDFMKKYPQKPFIEGEALYEFCSTLEELGTRMCTADMLRRVAYMSIQLGGCGYTYGAQGIWDNVWEKGSQNPMMLFNRFDVTWYEAIDGIGGVQMGYMKKFYEEMHFEEMMPYEQGNDTNLFAKKTPLVSVNQDKSKIILYYADTARKSIELQGVKDTTYEGFWFDPRKGSKEALEGTILPQNKVLKTLPKKGEGDWVLVLCASKQE